MDKIISIIVPVYFEEKVVNECYLRIIKVFENISYKYEIIFVNDGSTDKTLPLLMDIADADKNVKIIDFSRNFGHQIAVTAGIDKARGDAAVVIDSDLQDPPEIILDMIEKWQEGYDVVYARRKKREGETFFKVSTAKLFYKFLNYMSDIKIPEDTGDFRLMDRKVIEVFKNMPEKNRFIRGMVTWLGFRQTYVEFVRNQRFAGESKYPLKKMVKLAEDGIISFSHKPIKIAKKTGIAFFSVFVVQLIYIIVALLTLKEISSWFIITTYMSFISALIFAALSIIGEYLVRIFDESNRRPLYIINKMINFDKDNNPGFR